MEILDLGCVHVHVSDSNYAEQSIEAMHGLPLGSRSRSPKEREMRRYPPRDDMNGDNNGGSFGRRPRHNEGTDVPLNRHTYTRSLPRRITTDHHLSTLT
jgi:hypothetical protein